MSSTSENTPFTVRLDAATIAALDELAKKTDRSRNWLVAQAVQDYVVLNEWQLGKITAGLTAADRGDFASEEDIKRLRGKFSSKKS